MQTHRTSTRKDTDRRSMFLGMAGLLAALSLSACAPMTATGMTPTGTGATGTSAGTISSAGASTTATTPAGTPSGSDVAAPSSAPGTSGSPTGATTSVTTPNNRNLATLIASDDRFTTLNRLIQQAGLADTLATGQYTVFAPTNDAFLKLSPSDLDALTADPARLRQVLLYHVVPGRVPGTALATASEFTTAQGGRITISRPTGGTESGTRTLVNGANLQPSSLDAGNGYIYIIDTVLMPPAS